MTGVSGEELSRLDGNSAAGVLQEVFAVEMTTAACTCAACRHVSAVGALYLYGGAMGCVLRCSNCEAMLLCITSVPAGHYVGMEGIVHIRSSEGRGEQASKAGP